MLHKLLELQNLILASKSPRRKRLFDQIGLQYKQIPSHIAENPLDLPEEEFARYYARKKVKEIARDYPKSFIVGADTIVVVNGQILGQTAKH